MRIARSLRLTAAAALSSVVATIAFTGPLSGTALAAPPPRSPAPVFTQTPPASTSSSAAAFQWTAPTSESFTCSLNGARFNGCGSGTTGSASVTARSGSNTFSVKGVLPKVGKTKPKATTTTYAWSVDTTPPQAPTVTAVTPNPTRNTTASISFSDGDPTAVSYACAVDSSNPADATACSSPYFVAGPLSETSHTAYVYAFDALSNRSLPGSTTWTVDTTKPGSPVFTTTPDSVTSATTATFDWSAVSGATGYTCSLDASTPAACTPAKNYSGLGEGTHTISVQATDSAGNVGLPAGFGWTIDRTAPPAPIILTGPSSATDQSSSTFTFGDADPTASFLCSLDAGAFSSCSTPFNTGALVPDASHTFQVEAVDGVGNVSVPSASYGWTVDTTGTAIVLSPPAFLDGPAAYSNDTDPSFTMLAYDDGTTQFKCSLDAAVTFNNCGAPDPVTNEATVSPHVVGQGLHVFAIKVTDGTNESSVTTYSWRLDTVAPAAPTFSATPATITASSDALFSYAAEANAQFTCSLDDAVATLCSNLTVLHGLLDGAHTFAVTATDSAGNTSSANTFSWTINHDAPMSPLLTGPSGLVKVDAGSATWSNTDPSVDEAQTTCKLDDQASVTSCASPFDLTGVGEGDHTFTVTVQNGLGAQAQSALNWTVDTIAPVINIADGSVPSGVVNTAAVSPVITIDDAHQDGFACDLVDGVEHLNCGPYADLADGLYTLTVTATDAAGNRAQDVVLSWTVDTTGPVIDVTDVPAAYTTSDSAAPTVTVTDDNDDPSALTCSLARGAVAVDSTCGPYSSLTDGAYTMTVNTKDLANNAATEVTKSWTVDTAAPTLSISGIGDGDVTNDKNVTPTIDQPGEVNANVPVCDLAGPSPSVTCGPYTNLADGSYVLTVDTTDKAGNAAPTQTVHFTIDTQAPNLSVTGVPSGVINVDHVTPVIDGDGGTVTCTLTGPSPSSDCGPYTGLSDGAYTLSVHDQDAAGNAAAVANRSFTVDTGAPTGTVVTPATLTGAARVTWSEPVSGLDLTKVALKETDSGKLIASTVTATTGSLTVTPKRRLVPGQHYTVSVAAGAVQDAASNPSSAASKAFRAQRVLQENTAVVTTTWSKVKNRTAFGRNFVREHKAGAQAKWTFRGRTLTWWTVTGPTEGKARVFVDGKRKATVNNYAPKTSLRVARTFKRLGVGRHVVTIRVLGVKGARNARGTFVSIDAFTVGKVRTATPKLATSWHRVTGSAYYARHAVSADLKGEAISLRFRGRSISWTTMRNRSQGKVAIYIDGVRKATVDNFSTRTIYKARRTVSKLTDKVHTLRIVVLGTHHKGAKGNAVTVDRFAIG